MLRHSPTFFFFFFNDTATTEIYTLSLHDALPISRPVRESGGDVPRAVVRRLHQRGAGSLPDAGRGDDQRHQPRSEEHTSELQSLAYLVCRLLLEKKKIIQLTRHSIRHSIS